MSMFPKNFLQVFNPSSALAILLILDDGDYWAKRGNFNVEARQAFRDALGGADLETSLQNLDHFIKVRVDNQNYVLYAKRIPSRNHLLAMIYPPNKQLYQIQKEMMASLRNLEDIFSKRRVRAKGVEQTLQFNREPSIHSVDEINEIHDPDWRKEYNGQAIQIEASSGEKDARKTDDQGKNSPDGQRKLYRVYGASMRGQKSDAFQQPLDVGIEVMMKERPWLPIGENWSASEEENAQKTFYAPLAPRTSNQFVNDETQGSVRARHPSNGSAEDLASILQDDFELNNAPSALDAWMLPSWEIEEAPPVALDDNRSKIKVGEPQTDDFDPDYEESVANITCYLIPRDSSHDLSLLADCLTDCFSELCLLYGWELAGLSVESQYVKWKFADFPECLIKKMLSIVQGYTSERIHHAFPELQEDEPADTFWSSEYFIETKNRSFDLIEP